MARLRALVAEQRPLMERLLPEAKRWERRGLDVTTGLCLAFADEPEPWERVRQLGDEMLAVLQQLEEVDPSGPKSGDLAHRMRWALGLQGDAP